jgi:hypothetical protein
VENGPIHAAEKQEASSPAYFSQGCVRVAGGSGYDADLLGLKDEAGIGTQGRLRFSTGRIAGFINRFVLKSSTYVLTRILAKLPVCG